MNKLTKLFDHITISVSKKPEVLTGIGVVGLLSASVLSAFATWKASKIAKEKECETTKEVVKATWKCYIPTAICATVSTSCIFVATAASARKNMAMAAAYTLAETSLRDYQKEVKEALGEKKEQMIKDKVAVKKLESMPAKDEAKVISTGNGNTLCLDSNSGRYFRSSIEKLRKVENIINRNMRDEMTIPLNDFYYELGLPDIKLGEWLGWDIDKGYLTLELTSALDDNDEPTLVIDYKLYPIYA